MVPTQNYLSLSHIHIREILNRNYRKELHVRNVSG